jgi:hypothetical protein
MPGPYQYDDDKPSALETIGNVLVPGPTAAYRFVQSGGFENVPGLDFFLNPDKYPSSASLLNAQGWNTYNTRKAKEAAGTWTNEPYKYTDTDDPVTLAAQNGISPQQLLDANEGGYPFSVGQTVNLPTWKELPASTAPAATTPQQPATPALAPGASVTAPGPRNTDFSKTRAAQYYAAAGTPFLQQQRWDPQRKKYVSVGKLLKQGKLDLQGNWHKRRKGGGGGQQQKAQAAQDNTLTNSLIKFSVGSG